MADTMRWFGEYRQALRGLLRRWGLDRDPTLTCQTTYRWLQEFQGDRYDFPTPNHSELMIKRSVN